MADDLERLLNPGANEPAFPLRVCNGLFDVPGQLGISTAIETPHRP